MDKPELAARFNGQVVFIGVTSISATYDRVATPNGRGRIPGVEVHAQLFETLERGRFLTELRTRRYWVSAWPPECRRA